MSILVSGSVAFDSIITTMGKFGDQIAPGSHEDFHLSLISPIMRKEFGGTAGNIAFNLALLGVRPAIVAAVGEDACAYVERLGKLGIVTDGIKVFPNQFSPQCFVMYDDAAGQINTFHPGAMDFSGELSIGPGTYTHAIIAPDSKAGIQQRMKECEERGIYRIFDPGQMTFIFNGDELKDLTIRANLTIMNEYEREMFKKFSGTDFVELCRDYGSVGIVTKGEKGSDIYLESGMVSIPPIYVEDAINPTGCGDAFRAGLLYGLSQGWEIEQSARLGSVLGGIKVRHHGGQNHFFDHASIDILAEREFGKKFFA